MFVSKLVLCSLALLAAVSWTEAFPKLGKESGRSYEEARDAIQTLMEFLNNAASNAMETGTGLRQNIGQAASNWKDQASRQLTEAESTVYRYFQEWWSYADTHFQIDVRQCILGEDYIHALGQVGNAGVNYCAQKFPMRAGEEINAYDSDVRNLLLQVEDLSRYLDQCSDDACYDQVLQRAQELHDSLPNTVDELKNNIVQEVSQLNNAMNQCSETYLNRYLNKFTQIAQESYECVKNMIGTDPGSKPLS